MLSEQRQLPRILFLALKKFSCLCEMECEVATCQKLLQKNMYEIPKPDITWEGTFSISNKQKRFNPTDVFETESNYNVFATKNMTPYSLFRTHQLPNASLTLQDQQNKLLKKHSMKETEPALTS